MGIKMKVRYLSDIHLDVDELILHRHYMGLGVESGNIPEYTRLCLDQWRLKQLEVLRDVLPWHDTDSESVLVIAGDIFRINDVCSSAEVFFQALSERFRAVVYVPGNHEWYHLTYDEKEVVKYKKQIAKKWNNIHLMHCNHLILDKTVFIGATLWTDMNKDCWATKQIAKRSLNDFRCIKPEFTPDDSTVLHNQHLEYIKNSIVEFEQDYNVVVVTHHAPSLMSVAERFKNDFPMSWCFISDLDLVSIASKPVTWIHGHTHNNFDYTIGHVRVVCNPRAYPKENVYDFDPNAHFEIA